ncbi:SDR family oxidoreductase [Marinomonas ostreistagni]|uniref:SDR family oxidoreductase n=1 Tax=Marinomonas ostreistagni TaxID=359209 RepID=UPI00194EC739|nr:SDR family oxidoreductase [Marinomonas ostreistagni]MBM6549516.1 SDR family oxidoreductase [Marinomonas ostreistagni]
MSSVQSYCLLTGATGGIGQAIAKALANEGIKLLLQGRNEAGLEQLRAQLPGQHEIIVADLATATGRQQLIRRAYLLGELSMLINNAGISHLSLLEETEEALLQSIMQTNLIAPMLITQGLLPLLERQPSSTIVNVGSTFGSIGFAAQTSYCASKFGLRGFTEALRRELADTSIKVLYLAPRATQTSINSDAAMAMNQHLGNAVDTPEKVAQALLKQLHAQRARTFIGFPERLFVLLNSLMPSLIDRALKSKLNLIKHYSSRPLGEENKL